MRFLEWLSDNDGFALTFGLCVVVPLCGIVSYATYEIITLFTK